MALTTTVYRVTGRKGWPAYSTSTLCSLFCHTFRSSIFNETILLLPLAVILFLISWQDGFSVHSRYVLPLLPFLLIWTSKLGRWFESQDFTTSFTTLLLRFIVVILMMWGTFSSLLAFPHSMSYFNEFVGGSANGGRYLLGSDLDWGQDVYYLQHWQKTHSAARPLRISLSWTMPLENTAIKYDGVVPKEGDGTNIYAAIKPGWYAVNVNNLYNKNNEYAYLRNKIPAARAGWSINIYHFDEQEIDLKRAESGLPTIQEEQATIAHFSAEFLRRKQTVPQTTKVALYSGKGSTEGSVTAIKSLLTEAGCFCREMDVADIRSDSLSDFDLIVVPGGLSNEMADALGKEGCNEIRQFVRNGGGYVGICAGAYLASSTFERFLGLVNVKTNHSQEYMPRVGMQEQRQLGASEVDIHFTAEGQTFFNHKEHGVIDYINGPIFIEAGRLDLPSFLTLATYQSDIYQYHFQQGTMPNTPAIIASRYGNGNVFLFSPHPEVTKGMESLLIYVVRAVGKRCPCSRVLPESENAGFGAENGRY